MHRAIGVESAGLDGDTQTGDTVLTLQHWASLIEEALDEGVRRFGGAEFAEPRRDSAEDQVMPGWLRQKWSQLCVSLRNACFPQACRRLRHHEIARVASRQ